METNRLCRFAMITDLWLAQDGLAEGHEIVVDMEGSSLSHLSKVNIISMKKFMYYIQVKCNVMHMFHSNYNKIFSSIIISQEALPVRLKGLHFINTPPFMDKVLALMRPFMKKELMDAMHLHQTKDSYIGKHLDAKLMPKEYGGEAGTLQEIQCKLFVNNRQM